MANTFTDVKRWDLAIAKGPRMAIVDITIVDNYATGGWPITAANLKFDTVIMALAVMGGSVGTGNFQYWWDQVAGKLQAFTSNGAAPAQLLELGNGSAVGAGDILRCLAIGW